MKFENIGETRKREAKAYENSPHSVEHITRFLEENPEMNHSEFLSYFKKVNRELGSFHNLYGGDTRVQVKVLEKFLEKRLSDAQNLKGLPLFAQFISMMQNHNINTKDLDSTYNQVVQVAFSEKLLAEELDDLSFTDLVDIMWAQSSNMN